MFREIAHGLPQELLACISYSIFRSSLVLRFPLRHSHLQLLPLLNQSRLARGVVTLLVETIIVCVLWFVHLLLEMLLPSLDNLLNHLEITLFLTQGLLLVRHSVAAGLVHGQLVALLLGGFIDELGELVILLVNLMRLFQSLQHLHWLFGMRSGVLLVNIVVNKLIDLLLMFLVYFDKLLTKLRLAHPLHRFV